MTDTRPSPRRQTEADRLLEEITRASLKVKKSDRSASAKRSSPQRAPKRQPAASRTVEETSLHRTAPAPEQMVENRPEDRALRETEPRPEDITEVREQQEPKPTLWSRLRKGASSIGATTVASTPSRPRTTPRWLATLGRLLACPVALRYYLPLLLIALLLGGVIAMGEPSSGSRAREASVSTGVYAVMPLERPYRYIGSFRRDFDDLNPIQLEAAQAIGITPARTREELQERPELVQLTESPYLKIDQLTHSEPLLVPEAAELVREIAAAFHRQLEVDQQPLYRLVVTSVTRTSEDMKDLRQRNGNASPNSTHCYGTTLDISWQRYDKVDPSDPRTIAPEELKHLLARVLHDFHQAGRCYIKHERRQACFHITVRPQR